MGAHERNYFRSFTTRTPEVVIHIDMWIRRRQWDDFVSAINALSREILFMALDMSKNDAAEAHLKTSVDAAVARIKDLEAQVKALQDTSADQAQADAIAAKTETSAVELDAAVPAKVA